MTICHKCKGLIPDKDFNFKHPEYWTKKWCNCPIIPVKEAPK